MAAIHPRVVDQALPTRHGPRLLEVHPHHDQQIILMPVPQGGQAARVVEGGRRVVHGTGPGHHEEAVIGPVEHGADLVPGTLDPRHRRLAERQLVKESRR
jgi:hypothetical protein